MPWPFGGVTFTFAADRTGSLSTTKNVVLQEVGL